MNVYIYIYARINICALYVCVHTYPLYKYRGTKAVIQVALASDFGKS